MQGGGISRAAPAVRRGRCRRRRPASSPVSTLQHQHHEQHVQGHAELDDQPDPGRREEPDGGDAVVHQQEADQLRQRAPAGDQHEEPDQHHCHPDRDRRGGR